MMDSFVLTSSLRMILALVAAAGAVGFMASRLGAKMKPAQYGLMGLVVLTAAIHMLSGASDYLLYLNGVGYLVLLTLLYFVPWGPLDEYRWVGYVALAGYAVATIVGYFVVHPWGMFGESVDWLGWSTKAAEVALLGLLAVDYARYTRNRASLPIGHQARAAAAVRAKALRQPAANGRRNGKSALGEIKNSPALAVRGLAFSYPDKPGVLKSIDLDIMPGERVGLIGPNGAGKTTFFMSICGVQKPEAGDIALFGQPMKHRDFRPEIGMVFQKSDDQLFSPSVRDDVAFGPQNLGLSQAEVEQRVAEALATTGVSELAGRPPHHLSGGEKRMVSIAGVMAMRPQLVIYDEPSANLDIRSRRRLIRFLLAAEHAFILSSHDLELVLEVCDRVLLLDDGQIIADGPPRQVMSNVELMEAHGLERPHSLTPHLQPVLNGA